MSFAASMLVALFVEWVIGWPHWIYSRIGHPVTWVGSLIAAFELRLNHGPAAHRFWMGLITVAAVIVVSVVPFGLLQLALAEDWTGWFIAGVFAWPLVASRSLYAHVMEVARPLLRNDIKVARDKVSMIVGRDTARLDEAGIVRAALESLAENVSDGVVAPVFWGVVAGLPGIAAYKAINTLDSMIGHRNVRYEWFGKAAALTDDAANLIPARLTGFDFVLVSGRTETALAVMCRDAPAHRSPNAGWPEAAMAAALNVRLSGPRAYGARFTEEPWLNAGAPEPGPENLTSGLTVFVRATLMIVAVLLGLAAI